MAPQLPASSNISTLNAPQPDDLHWMTRALQLAETVVYTTTPNPRVGCVIVRDGEVIGEGATQPVGGPHAEVCALRAAEASGQNVAGATVYVTLEPCSHFGRTPPCVDALIAAKVARVVVAMGDPNPAVNGQGIKRLLAANIAVSTGVCTAQALALNVGFISRMHTGRPWLWAKMATSLDGRSALLNGVSQWITGPQARADGHHWRARACVVLTGMGTVERDNPQLTVRDVATTRQPRKAVIDGLLSISPQAKLFDGSEVWVFTATHDDSRASALEAVGAKIIQMPSDRAGKVDLAGVVQWMGQHDINEVHIEAGARLTGALIAAAQVDELLVYMAPMLLGDGAGLAALPALEHLDSVQRYHFHDVVPVGEDLRMRARVPSRWNALLASVEIKV